jgi:hypothetical protein
MLFVAVMAVLPIINSACGDKDDGIFIPILENQWTNEIDDTNTFFFFNFQNDVNESTFDGNENPPGGGSQFHFSGSYKNHNIELTYDNASGNKSGKKFTGTINDASNKITLKGPGAADKITLLKK